MINNNHKIALKGATVCLPFYMNMPQNPQCPYYCVPSEEKQQDMSLSISTNGNASITVSVEVNGTIYSGLYGGVVIK